MSSLGGSWWRRFDPSGVGELQAVILAGGLGRRVRPLSLNRPKPMFKILGKPLIQHVIETLREAGLKDLIVVVGHLGEQIQNYLGDGSRIGVNIQYTVQEKPLGMANALETAEDLVEDHFFVVNADDIFESSLVREMLKRFQRGDADILLSCKPVKETWKFGIVRLEDGDRVVELVEKPERGREPSNLAVIGVYLLTKRIFEYCRRVPVSDHQYEDAIQRFIEDGNVVRVVPYKGFFAAYKYPWDLFTINRYLMDQHIKEPILEDGVEISERAVGAGRVWIRSGARSREGACVRGPCYIGRGTLIGNNSLVWNYSSIGEGCVVGYSTEIKHSIIGDHCWFHRNYIGDSILGDHCSFGAGAVTANLRFDEETVKVTIEGRRVDSGRVKLGAIVADGCRVGVNATLLPGVKVGPFSIVGPNVCLYRDLDPNKAIFVDRRSFIIRERKIKIEPKGRKPPLSLSEQAA